MKKKLESKVMHGQYIRSVDRLLAKQTRSYGWREEIWKKRLKVK